MKNFYILLGPEDLDADDFIDSLYKKASASGSIEKKQLYAFDEEDIEKAISDIFSQSLFGNEYFVVINNCESLSEKNASRLASAISQSQENSYLILRSVENSISSKLDKLCLKENKKIFYLLFESKKPQFVTQAFAEKGYNIDNVALQAFLSLVEPDKKSILASRDKFLSLLSANNIDAKAIDVDLVYRFLDHDRDEDGFSIFSFLAKRDIQSTIKATESVISSLSSPYMQIIPSLIMYLRRALCYVENLENNAKEPWFVNIISSPGVVIRYPAEKDLIVKLSKNYTKNEIIKILKVLLEVDVEIRKLNSPVLQKIYFQTKLSKVIAK